MPRRIPIAALPKLAVGAASEVNRTPPGPRNAFGPVPVTRIVKELVAERAGPRPFHARSGL